MRTLTEQKRNAILAAASSIFLEQGYERTSMSEVAKRAGGSKATLYNYYPSKESLFEAVIRAYSTNFLTGAAEELISAEAETHNLEEKLQRFGSRMLGVLMTDWQAMQLYRLVIGEAGHSNTGELFYESGVRQSMDALSRLMKHHIDNGDLGQSSPALRAKQFTALLKAEADELMLRRERPAFSETQISSMVESAVRLFLAGAR